MRFSVRLLTLGALLVFALNVGAAEAARAEQATEQGAHAEAGASPMPLTQEQRELIDAQTKNERAQQDYFAKQAAKLDREAGGKSVFDRLVGGLLDNPAGILGLVGAFLALMGASVAARVAYLSFFFNYHSTLKNQTDNQLFEALKRFGDGSPAVRSGAAGALALMGRMKIKQLSKPNPGLLMRASKLLAEEQPYLAAALDQLLSGLMIEEDRTVLAVIQAGLEALFPHSKESYLRGLRAANRHLQETVVASLAEYFAAGEAATREEISSAMWGVAGTLTNYRSTDLQRLVELYDKQIGHHVVQRAGEGAGPKISIVKDQRPARYFTNRFNNYRAMFEPLNAEQKAARRVAVTNSLASAAARLHAASRLLMAAEPTASDTEDGASDLFLTETDRPAAYASLTTPNEANTGS
jgi:hypothetical protein